MKQKIVIKSFSALSCVLTVPGGGTTAAPALSVAVPRPRVTPVRVYRLDWPATGLGEAAGEGRSAPVGQGTERMADGEGLAGMKMPCVSQGC